MIRYSPYWLDTFPKSKRPTYPRWRGNAETKVVVIGGGLTGCACAYSLAGAGIPVILLEAERIGAGGTAASAGLVREDFDTSFEATARAHGLRSARSLWQGARRASLDFAAALRRLRIRCDLAPLDLLRLCRAEPDAVRRLRSRGPVTARCRLRPELRFPPARSGGRRRSTQEARSSREAFRSIRIAPALASRPRRRRGRPESSSTRRSPAFATVASRSKS